MQATILLFGRCPVCGYRNRGVQVGTLRPGIRSACLQPDSLVAFPWSCEECRHPLSPHLIEQHLLNAETTAKLRAWQDRRRAKRKAS
jgi:hypothetical protein